MSAYILNVEQGQSDWFAARLGIVTASHFKDVISKGRGKSESQTRRTYMMKLLAERITGEVQPGHYNEHMLRGHEDEPKARDTYEFLSGNKVRQVGIIVDKTLRAGFSPDGLVGEDGCIEIKSKMAHLHIDCILKDEVPVEHMAQIQGGLLVSGRKWCDFVSYCRAPELDLFIKRVERDEEAISKIRDAIVEFNKQIDAFEKKIREME